MSGKATLSRTLRNAGRAQHIVAVLIRHGFADAVQAIGFEKLLGRGMKLIGQDPDLLHQPQAVRLRRALEELGPTFVKIGQILSTRPDLIPADWAKEFARLQDNVPAVPFDEIEKALNEQYPQGYASVFASIESDALAAGSMAQVHRATLADGTRVVVKVLRPGIRKIVHADMEILGMLAEFAQEHFADLGYSPTKVVEAFSRELEREVDFTREARSTDRLYRDFDQNPNVIFPKVYHDASTMSVLVLEELQGIALSQFTPGDLDQREIEQLVAHGVDAVFRQTLETGFFHADPHPGNLFAMEGGRVGFIDCGMTGHVEPATAEQLAALVQGVITGNLDQVIHVVIELTDTDPAIARDRMFRADVWDFISRFENISLGELNMALLLQEFFDRIRAHHLQCPSDLVFLIKAITTIQGVGEQLAPDYDFISHVRPYVERLVRQRFGPGALRKRFTSALLNYTRFAEELPGQIQSLLFDFKRSKLTVNIEHNGIDRLINTIEHASGNIAHGVVVAALLMGSSILILASSGAGANDVGAWILRISAIVIFFGAIGIGTLRIMTSWFR